MKSYPKYIPAHKELVLCLIDGCEIPIPAIYYDNQSFKGFYKFTTYYATNKITPYFKTKLRDKDKINNVKKWLSIESLVEDNI